MNCFIGHNGEGKTNLLDAVYFLSFCKSATHSVDSQNIRHGEDFFMLQGEYEHESGEPEEVYCGLKRKQKKRFKRNKKEYKRIVGAYRIGAGSARFSGRCRFDFGGE